jgi:acyl transferase domain-containing protein
MLTKVLSNGYNGDGISRPSVKGQTNVISLAYKLARLEQDTTEYIECHGTGTQVGDPIEVKAIHEAMGAVRPPGNPILIGSVRNPFCLFETTTSDIQRVGQSKCRPW